MEKAKYFYAPDNPPALLIEYAFLAFYSWIDFITGYGLYLSDDNVLRAVPSYGFEAYISGVFISWRLASKYCAKLANPPIVDGIALLSQLILGIPGVPPAYPGNAFI